MKAGAPRQPVVGILGGMGPDATVELMRRVLRATPARDDADHIRMIVDNNPKVPTRNTALIEGTGEVVRMGGSLIFVRGLITTGPRPMMSFSGVIKKLRPRP